MWKRIICLLISSQLVMGNMHGVQDTPRAAAESLRTESRLSKECLAPENQPFQKNSQTEGGLSQGSLKEENDPSKERLGLEEQSSKESLKAENYPSSKNLELGEQSSKESLEAENDPSRENLEKEGQSSEESPEERRHSLKESLEAEKHVSEESLESEKRKAFRERFEELQNKWGLLEYEKEDDRFFQTGRLLAETGREFDLYGAKEALRHENFFVLQYDTLEAVKEAYKKLLKDGIQVVPDILSENLELEWEFFTGQEGNGEGGKPWEGFLERWRMLLFSEDAFEEEQWSEEISQPERYNTKEEYYGKQDDCKSNSGHFYLFVRKEDVKIEKGAWYKIEMSLPTVSSYQSQDITWRLLYLKKKEGGISNIANWSWTIKAPSGEDPYSLALEKGKSWEKTRQNGSGANPVLRNMPAIPENTNGYYFKLCGKLLYEYPGYHMVLDESVYQDLDLFDIEPENMQIQRKDDVLDPEEKPWTGHGYFKFAIDTNNTGMTNYGESHKFHHAVFGLCLKPNQYVVKYEPNGGSGTMKDTKAIYDIAFSLRGNQFKRAGYTFAGWSVKADGSGKRYKNKEAGLMNLATKDGQAVTLYAQWKPVVYKVTLKNQLKSPKTAGTKKIYKKYGEGWYLDALCTEPLKAQKKNEKIIIPEKEGYVFLGYYDAIEGGSKMISKEGKLTQKGAAGSMLMEDSVWYAHYKYLVTCQDFADVPCDLNKSNLGSREEGKAFLSYEEGLKSTVIQMEQIGFTVQLKGMPEGTQIGIFTSKKKGASASGASGQSGKATLSFSPEESAAYQLTVMKNGKKLLEKEVYFYGGRFRALLKLGEQAKAKKKEAKDHASGEEWGVYAEEYPNYQCAGYSSVENIQSPEQVSRYFIYRDINVAYNGNGATEGKNMMECSVPLEACYQFRDNPYRKSETMTKKTAEGKSYTCKVKYGFQGWRLGISRQQSQEQEASLADAFAEGIYKLPSKGEMIEIYEQAKMKNAISKVPVEPLETYHISSPYVDTRPAFHQVSPLLVTEYINFMAEWDAFPTIVQKPGDKMEFYEGEEVSKEALVSHLAVHDTEDSAQQNLGTEISDKVQIRKIAYPASRNKSQKAYVKEYKEDVPEGFLLDTYYLKLEENEGVDVLVTFSVTDSVGNTTEEVIPVTVKYNHYPEIQSEDVFYYLKEEANRGEITAESLLSQAKAKDTEDGDISEKLSLKEFDPQLLRMQREPKAEFKAIYQVTDAYKKTSSKEVKLIVWDEEAEGQMAPQSYVRYISKEHLDTLEEHSIWRETQNHDYLQSILQKQEPAETWEFSHEDVLAAQEWMTEGGSGNWKAGQEANQGFLERFSECKK